MPNEILMSVFDYVQDSNTSFRGLNRRIDDILQSMNYGSFTIDDLDDAIVPGFSHLLTRLVIKTTKPINFKCFPALRSLSLKTGTQTQLEQIQPNLMPHLTYLSLSMPFYCSLSDLSRNSGRLQRDANLTGITMIYDRPWSETDCPSSISIECSHLDAVSFILNECPKIKRLRLEMFTGVNVHPSDFPSSNFKLRSYPVKHLVIKDEEGVLPLECLDTFLSHLHNVEDVELRLFSLCFTDVAKVIAKRLINLRKFRCTMVDCFANDQLINIEEIRCLHPMFQRIQLKISQKEGGKTNLIFFLFEWFNLRCKWKIFSRSSYQRKKFLSLFWKRTTKKSWRLHCEKIRKQRESKCPASSFLHVTLLRLFIDLQMMNCQLSRWDFHTKTSKTVLNTIDLRVRYSRQYPNFTSATRIISRL